MFNLMNIDVPSGSCSSEGCGFTFRFQEGIMDKAEVNIFLPHGGASGIKAPKSILLNCLLKLA